jgi:hypothetical protein
LRADRILQSSSRPPSSRAFLVGSRKVYSVRCEADVVMTSVICGGGFQGIGAKESIRVCGVTSKHSRTSLFKRAEISFLDPPTTVNMRS